MIWEEFKKAAPELARLGETRFAASGMILLGTLRKNGFPRITPVEAFIVDGHLYLGMIWQSRKALDLLRDPRCTIHNTISKKDGTEGEFKLYGRAIAITDLAMRKRYCDTLFELIGWKPDEPEFHLFSIDIESAAFNIVEDEAVVARRWTPESGLQIVRSWRASQ
ncbi:MAG: pyridoxamine 5'-phosphate oxidase family protein [Acidobacteriota bacterium]